MGTVINPLDGEYDLDDGVYLQHLDEHEQSGWPTPETVHRWIIEATDGYTKEKPIDKRTCVRVRYARQYHIEPTLVCNTQWQVDVGRERRERLASWP